MGVSYFGYDFFRSKEIIYNFTKILMGKGDGSSPYYVYQLWYIYTMIRGYTLAFGFWALFGRSHVYRYIAYAIALLYFMFVDSALFCIFVGLLAGDVAKQRDQRLFNERYYLVCVCLAVILIIISPMFFDGSNKDSDVMLLGGTLAVIVLLMYIIEMKPLFNGCKCIDFFDRYTYAFYLVHVFVLDLFSQIVLERINVYAHTSKDEMLIILISKIITMLIAIIFDYMIVRKTAKYSICMVNIFRIVDADIKNVKGDV